mgnify:CR=1 FL=1
MGGDDRRIGIPASYERRTAKDAEGERKREGVAGGRVDAAAPYLPWCAAIR